jgi:VanZ family protein
MPSVRRKSREKNLLQTAKQLISALLFSCSNLPRQVLGVLAVFTLCSILAIGLWPFHSPRNEVHWLENDNGLRFDHYGTVLSTGIFERASSDGPSVSIEFWMSPTSAWNTGTLIAFYSPLASRQFSLRQRYTDLELQLDIGGQHPQRSLAEMRVHDVFRKKQALVTVTSDGQETAVYVDGQLVTRSRWFGLSADDLTGRLILGTSALQGDSWPGRLRGLALYGSELSAAQVAQHYEEWTQKGKPVATDNERVCALYLFDEHAGRIVHDYSGSGGDLYISEHFLVLHQIFLEPPWSEMRTQHSYVKNVLINVAGFVPLGLLWSAYFSSLWRIRWAAAATVMLGFAVSLTIEILQASLPTRYSGMTDIITNTFGTCLGVVFYYAVALPLARVVPRHGWWGAPTYPRAGKTNHSGADERG